MEKARNVPKPGTIQMNHFYEYPPAAVWKALTDPATHARWWASGDVKATVGHRFDLDMGTWGKQPCEVTQVAHERLFEYRFATTTLNTTITWELIREGRGTRLKLAQIGFDVNSPIGQQAHEGMKKGWPSLLDRLESVLV